MDVPLSTRRPRLSFLALIIPLLVGAPSAAGHSAPATASVWFSGGMAYPVPVAEVSVRREITQKLSGSAFGRAWMTPLDKGLKLGAVHAGAGLRYEPQIQIAPGSPVQPYFGLAAAWMKANLNTPPASPDLVLRDVIAVWGEAGLAAPVGDRFSIDAAFQPMFAAQPGRGGGFGFVLQFLMKWRL